MSAGCLCADCPTVAVLAGVIVDRLSGRNARNCDLYPTCNAAWKAYNAIGDRGRLPPFDFWLFEPAAPDGPTDRPTDRQTDRQTL